MGWVIATESMDELQAIADRIGLEVASEGKREGDKELAWKRRRPNGMSHRNENVPDDRHHAWPRGLPMFMHWPGEADGDHPDLIPEALTVDHRRQPAGIAWVEVGDEATTREWLGPVALDLDVRYLDAPAGLYGIGVRTETTEVAIRRPAVPLALGVHYRP